MLMALPTGFVSAPKILLAVFFSIRATMAPEAYSSSVKSRPLTILPPFAVTKPFPTPRTVVLVCFLPEVSWAEDPCAPERYSYFPMPWEILSSSSTVTVRPAFA